jgi:hypothetical protein
MSKHLTPKTINDPMKKWVNKLNRAFTKKEVQMAKKHMKKCSLSLAIKEMQIKTTLRFHLTPVRMAIIKSTNNNCLVPVAYICNPSYSRGRDQEDHGSKPAWINILKKPSQKRAGRLP